MAYFIRLEVKEDLEFLQSIMDRTIEKVRRNGLTVLAGNEETIIRIHDAVHNAVPAKDATRVGITDEFGEIEVPRTRRSKAELEAEGIIDPNFCKDHPKYGAKRPPRTDCDICWEQYKKFHPLEYDRARAKFEKTL